MVKPILADGIDIGFVLLWGVGILVPLMAFEVFVEAAILRKVWRLPYRDLCRFAFVANCWSLAAGIPTAILADFLDGKILPTDLPGYFERLPIAAAVGALIYFAVTLIVEGVYAIRWWRRNNLAIPAGSLWTGIVLANVATYAVLAPLHYLGTRPVQDVKQLNRDASWTKNPAARAVYIDITNSHLKSIRLDGTGEETLVSTEVRDYSFSADLKICLYRGADNNLHMQTREPSRTNLVWQTAETFTMDQVAFSPSGRYAAFVSTKSNSVGVIDTLTGNRGKASPETSIGDFPSLVWSSEETRLYLSGKPRISIHIQPDLSLVTSQISDGELPDPLPCFGRVGALGHHRGEGGFQEPLYDTDKCEDFTAITVHGMDNRLVIGNNDTNHPQRIVLAVNPGLIHLSDYRILFHEMGFLNDCNECVFQAGDFIYLLDINQRRVGMVACGKQFSLLNNRYRKSLP